jgi:hypothetical protein
LPICPGSLPLVHLRQLVVDGDETSDPLMNIFALTSIVADILQDRMGAAASIVLGAAMPRQSHKRPRRPLQSTWTTGPIRTHVV